MIAPSAVHEFRDLYLGDRRLERRARQLVEAMEKSPARGFPSVYGSEAELEAHYRFVNNDRVTADALGTAHAKSSWRRAAERGDEPVLAIADTTEFSFNGEVSREGLMPGDTASKFLGHFTLLATEGELPEVLGVVAQQAFVRKDGAWCEVYDDEREPEELLSGMDRWIHQAQEVRQRAPEQQSVIHVIALHGLTRGP